MKDILLITHFLIFVFCFVGCRSTRATLTQDTHLLSQQNTVDSSAVNTEAFSNENISITTHEEMTINETIEETAWSEPDSAGKQYPVRTKINTKITNVSKGNVTDKNKHVKQKNSVVETKKTNRDIDYQNMSEVRKTVKKNNTLVDIRINSGNGINHWRDHCQKIRLVKQNIKTI
ncbi:MAG: hypothetical protein LBI60_02920 [Bacteroidales bacterium]|jgi:hypothetical protein|nr:hypothetical protein [Bacteroidales bacterium]